MPRLQLFSIDYVMKRQNNRFPVSDTGYVPLKCIVLQGVLVQLFNAVQYIHEQGYVHTDIHSENIVIDTSARVRLINFGGAMQIGTEIDPDNTLCTALFPWMEGAAVGTAPDIWAIGQVLLRLINMDESSNIVTEMFYELWSNQVRVAKSDVHWSPKRIQRQIRKRIQKEGCGPALLLIWVKI